MYKIKRPYEDENEADREKGQSCISLQFYLPLSARYHFPAMFLYLIVTSLL